MITITGKSNCPMCVNLENAVKKTGVEYQKVDLESDPDYMIKVMEGGNRTPACIFVGKERYVVSEKTPAKVPQIIQWLKEQDVL